MLGKEERDKQFWYAKRYRKADEAETKTEDLGNKLDVASIRFDKQAGNCSW